MSTNLAMQPLQKSWMDLYEQMTAIPDFMNERDDDPA